MVYMVLLYIGSDGLHEAIYYSEKHDALRYDIQRGKNAMSFFSDKHLATVVKGGFSLFKRFQAQASSFPG